jgi:hypothetical protein
MPSTALLRTAEADLRAAAGVRVISCGLPMSEIEPDRLKQLSGWEARQHNSDLTISTKYSTIVTGGLREQSG